MELSVRAPTELKPHPMNPKLHTEAQIEHIRESIGRFGFTQPVVIDENNTILVGHARTKAASLLGLKEIPVVIKKGLREAEKLALCLTDNHIAAQTEMDLLKVEDILRDLHYAEYDTAGLGLAMEIALPEIVEGESEPKPKEKQIKQIVFVFENADFDLVIREFEAIRRKNPQLKDNTEVFNTLLTAYERDSDDEDFGVEEEYDD